MNNPHYDEARRLSAEASLINEWGLTERRIMATRAQAEATLAIVYELQQNRMQAEQGPSHTGAAFLIPGALVTVNNPRSEWYGATGRVLDTSPSHTHISLPGHTRWIQTTHLEKADDK